ncbi:MAG: hypothetical protein J6T25_01265 [Bacilli bacterium]|nr:hypothetical protein [Bacilli bacterium]
MIFDLNDVEKKKVVALFDQHEKNIDYLLYIQALIWQKDINNQTNLETSDSYKKRDFLFENIEKKHPYPNEFIKKNMKWDTKLLRVEDFQTNPYFKKLSSVNFNKNDWSLTNKKLEAYSLFPYEEEYHYASNYLLKMSLGFFDQDYNYPSISLFGNEWMSLNPYEIRTMETPIITARGKVLTLGLGLGYFAYMAHLKDEVKEVHIVEMDKGLIEIFNEYLLPLFEHPEKIHIHKADAFRFVESINDKDYDFIFSDLWHDVSDGLPMYLKLKYKFNSFKYTQCHYWIESALVTYLRTLVIGVMRDEYYQIDNEYNDLQLLIKNRLKNYRISDSYELDAILSIKGLNLLMIN